MIPFWTFLLGALLMQLIGRGIDCGVIARRERDAALGALRELVRAVGRGRPDFPNPARESRAWAHALSVLMSHAKPAHSTYRRIPAQPAPKGDRDAR